MEKLLLTIKETSAQTGYCPEMVYREIRANRLPVVRNGRSTRIPAEAVKAWIAARTETWDGAPWTPKAQMIDAAGERRA